MTKTWKFLVIAALAALLALPAQAQDKPQDKPLTVVELYTSQGCSSCPPADKFLAELARRDDVLALSLHVDYWDYLGWKDPYADPANGRRQRDYAAKLRLRYVYTPQMVVQGAAHATGSDRSTIKALITKAAAGPHLAVGLKRAGKTLDVMLPDAAADGTAAVWMALFDTEHKTAIKRGENAGRTLTYHNVVREMTRIGTWHGKAMTIPYAMGNRDDAGRDGCAVLVQSEATGRILGAARIALGK